MVFTTGHCLALLFVLVFFFSPVQHCDHSLGEERAGLCAFQGNQDNQGIPRLKRRGGTCITASEIQQAEDFNGQLTDVFNKNDHNEVPFLSRSAPFMDDIVVSNVGVIKFLKGLWPLLDSPHCPLHCILLCPS